MMSLRQAVRLAVFVIRHREIPAALRAQVVAEDAEDTAFVDRLIAETFGDHLAARVAVENFPLGRPRLTVMAGGTS